MSHFLRKYSLVLLLLSAFIAGCNSGTTTSSVSEEESQAAVVVDNASDTKAALVVEKQEKAVKSVETQKTESKAADGYGILTPDTKKYEFGEIEPGGLKYGKFILTNTGDKDLEIDRVTAPCRCTVPELPKKNLAPGESVELKFTFNVGNSHGTVQKKINLTTKSPAKPSNMTLTFTADIKKVVDVTPQKIDFALNSKADNVQEIILKSTDGTEFKVTGFVSNKDAVNVKYDPTIKAKMHKLVVEPNLEKLRNAPIGFITIKTDHPKVNRMTVRYGTKMPFEAYPKTRRFVPDTEAGRKAKVKVVSNFKEDFEVGDVTSKSGYIKLSGIEKSIDGYTIEIEMDMDKIGEAKNSQKYVSDYLYIPIKGHPEDTLEVHCYGLIK